MSINRKGYKFQEPLDNEIPIEHPMKIKSILQLLFDKNIYSVSGLMDELKVDISFFSDLTGIEENFFYNHRKQETKRFSVSELGLKNVK